MKKTLTLTIMAVMLAFGAKGAWADGPFPAPLTDGAYGPPGQVTPNGNTGEVEIYQAIDQLLDTSAYTNNAQVDSLEYTGNASTWQETGNGGYTVIGLGAGNTNTIEVYNSATPGTLLNPIGGFSGDTLFGPGTTSSNPYPGAGAVFTPGTQFGFALTSAGSSSSVTWYSNPSLNSDGMDHMLVYNLPQLAGTQIYVYDPVTKTETLVTLQDPYLLAFEDLPEGGVNGAPSDLDYDDLMVLVDGVAPVPEPATWALLFAGLAGIGLISLRRRFTIVK